METAEGCSDMGAPFLQCTAALLVIGSGHSLAAGARPASPRASVPSGDHPPFFSCSLPRAPQPVHLQTWVSLTAPSGLPGLLRFRRTSVDSWGPRIGV